MSIDTYLLAIVVGVITGGVTSLIGASGVMVIVPILTLIFHVGTHSAIGTSLFVDVIASITVSYNYYKNGNIDLKRGIWIALSSIIGAQLGAMFSSQIKEQSLSYFFGIALVISGVLLFVRNSKMKSEDKKPAEKSIRFTKGWQQIVSSIIIGMGIGIFSGMFGAGGGVMILLALIIILSFPMHIAIGTSTLIMAMTALSSTIGYGVRGYLNLPLGCALAIGAIIGGTLGSRYANNVNELTLQKVVSIVFIFLGVVMTAIELNIA